ncbi:MULTISPECIES: GlxA family transcriptional regulator [Acinetobacter]|uniref:Helix-turn-helix domain-containing protein n=2 Tax=Acinetobacter TaxID=469 RepID=A0AAE8GAZ9_ACIPI|nr:MULTISPECIES: helix-turn-helix domain-containing protein [Acinetobacter]EXC28623.1 bacterial regulatory helix-turn-helix s, AraC family protein [Acinetobacter sp. 809848]MBE2163007.1 helix-turn-helix domain-containing protein [Acinetobacter oleivorans]MBN6522180.1 helix-turn-helix domain-containing protein [Acinetobacter pittii]MCH2051848.1 helix-turn-helix domain-containing protein [Acinetobacter pittii]MDE3321049.1 helix-turn-helix domain-containing protein [Acinetobacter nosocomialis]
MGNLVEIAILLYPTAHLSSVGGLTDLFKFINNQVPSSQSPQVKVTHWQSENDQIIKVFDSHENHKSQISFVIIPPSFEEPVSQQDAQIYVLWLKELYQRGVILCSICSGIFILLETGVLQGRTVTTHWSNITTLKTRSTHLKVDCNKMVVDENDIITTAGPMSWIDMGFTLTERIYDTSFMVKMAQYLLLDPPIRKQSYYKNFVPSFDHGDEVIVNAQHWLQTHYNETITVDMLVELTHLEKRTLLRRFKKATNLTIVEYCQNLRIQKAQDLLITTNLSFDSISWQAGYKDSSSFSKMFCKNIGLSPIEYRKRFK